MNALNQTPLEPAKRYLTREVVHIEICGRNAKIFCRLINLSTTGVMLKAVSTLIMPRQNDPIKITLNLKSLNKIHTIYAEIKWTKGVDFGAAFIDQKTASEKSKSTSVV